MNDELAERAVVALERIADALGNKKRQKGKSENAQVGSPIQDRDKLSWESIHEVRTTLIEFNVEIAKHAIFHLRKQYVKKIPIRERGMLTELVGEAARSMTEDSLSRRKVCLIGEDVSCTEVVKKYGDGSSEKRGASAKHYAIKLLNNYEREGMRVALQKDMVIQKRAKLKTLGYDSAGMPVVTKHRLVLLNDGETYAPAADCRVIDVEAPDPLDAEGIPPEVDEIIEQKIADGNFTTVCGNIEEAFDAEE